STGGAPGSACQARRADAPRAMGRGPMTLVLPSSLTFEEPEEALLARAVSGRADPPEAVALHLQAQRLARVGGFEEVLCLPLLRQVERPPHQERTALTVMRRFRGRAILGDEVGLGKTIEAALILKEYVLRGLVRRALVLCP